jgi:hypothetical protein
MFRCGVDVTKLHKKLDLTGSVSDVQSNDFNKGLVTSPSQLLLVMVLRVTRKFPIGFPR